MKNIYLLLLSIVLITGCTEDLDQAPPNIATSDSLTDFNDVLNAAYFYQLGAVTPMAVMGDFRADNALFDEQPYTDFDVFNANLPSMEDQFFRPFYSALYKSILSANNVIENGSDPTQIAEAKFLRGLSYFKLVQVFGNVPVNLSANPSITNSSILSRQPAVNVYNDVIIPDLMAAIAGLNTTITNGRASKYAAQGMLGKVYVAMGKFDLAAPQLATVVNGATAAGILLQDNFADVFATDLNSEIIFATQIASGVTDEYTYASEFYDWFSGGDTKADDPLDSRLTTAFNVSALTAINPIDGDLRKVLTIDEVGGDSVKWGDPLQDWIELRLADVILLYAEALNETSGDALTQLNKIRSRAGLANSTATGQAAIRTAIANERRLELAFEGQRWFDLVRTNATGVDAQYDVFPIPISEVLASFGVITQNEAYK